MQTNEQIKERVREKYAEIAEQGLGQNQASCCGATSACCGDEVYSIMADDYTKLDGYNADADLGLGCGLPTEYAKIKEGDTVIDLGSGAGFPGVPLAVALPASRLSLVDSVAKKVRFLEVVALASGEPANHHW